MDTTFLGVAALFRSKFLIKYLSHDFEIYMKKKFSLLMINRNKPLYKILPRTEVSMIYTLETADSTLNVDSPYYCVGKTNVYPDYPYLYLNWRLLSNPTLSSMQHKHAHWKFLVKYAGNQGQSVAKFNTGIWPDFEVPGHVMS